jgi:Fe2+ or Zn2+ uptake regulation protein
MIVEQNTLFERNTTLSNKVRQIIEEIDHAISISQLMVRLEKEGLHPNRTTLYRMMEKLQKKEIVTMITLKNGVSYFELAKKTKSPHHTHHHHFFCNNCELLFCLDHCHVDSLDIDLSQLLPTPNFQITAHDFNLYGVCEPCSK